MCLKDRYEKDLRFYYFSTLTRGETYSHFLSSKVILNIETYISLREYDTLEKFEPQKEHTFTVTIKVDGKISYRNKGLKMSELGISSLHPLDVIYSSLIYKGLVALNMPLITDVLKAYKACFGSSYDIASYINYLRNNITPNFFLFTKSYLLDNYVATLEFRRDVCVNEPDVLCCWVVLYNPEMRRVVTGYGEREVATVADEFDLENTCWQLLLDKCEKNFDYATYNDLKVNIRNRNLDLIIANL